MKVQKNIQKSEKKIKPAKTKLDETLKSDNEASIVTARKGVQKYKEDKNDAHKDWLSDQEAEIKECVGEKKITKKLKLYIKLFLKNIQMFICLYY